MLNIKIIFLLFLLNYQIYGHPPVPSSSQSTRPLPRSILLPRCCGEDARLLLKASQINNDTAEPGCTTFIQKLPWGLRNILLPELRETAMQNELDLETTNERLPLVRKECERVHLKFFMNTLGLNSATRSAPFHIVDFSSTLKIYSVVTRKPLFEPTEYCVDSVVIRKDEASQIDDITTGIFACVGGTREAGAEDSENGIQATSTSSGIRLVFTLTNAQSLLSLTTTIWVRNVLRI